MSCLEKTLELAVQRSATPSLQVRCEQHVPPVQHIRLDCTFRKASGYPIAAATYPDDAVWPITSSQLVCYSRLRHAFRGRHLNIEQYLYCTQHHRHLSVSSSSHNGHRIPSHHAPSGLCRRSCPARLFHLDRILGPRLQSCQTTASGTKCSRPVDQSRRLPRFSCSRYPSSSSP